MRLAAPVASISASILPSVVRTARSSQTEVDQGCGGSWSLPGSTLSEGGKDHSAACAAAPALL